MEDIPRKLLCSLIKQQSISIIQDPTKFRNLLVDYSKGEYKRERKCLSDSLLEDIPQTLLAKRNQLSYATVSQQLCQKLIRDLGINPELARWTVDSWAIAIGIIHGEELKSQDYTLSILSNPPGARVSLNGIIKGITPLNEKNLELKPYQLLVSYDGYEPWTQSITLDPKVNSTISINLTKNPVEPGSITIETYPSDAEIYLNSKKYGRTPKEIVNLSDGYYEIKLTHPGYKDIIQHRQVTPGLNLKICETFIQEHIPKQAKKAGNLIIDSSPSHASVYLDNQFAGKTPLRIRDVSLGNHSLSFQLSSYNESRRRIQVRDGEDLNIFETLVKPKTPQLKKAIYGISLLALLIIIVWFFASGNQGPPPVIPQTSVQNSAIVTKDLSVRSYGDYLSEGQTNTYFFDVSSDEANHKLLKVTSEAGHGNHISMAVGVGYLPSIDDQKFDYISVAYSTSVIDINNPKPGRYYVAVKGILGSGDTRVSRSFY
jgi:hypothetical protein